MENLVDSRKRVARATRQHIFDTLAAEHVVWSGRLEEPEFLGRIWDLETLPSHDHRFKTAAGDIFQHRVNNLDWEDDWIFGDSRFNLLGCDEETFLSFLCQMLHPRVRADAGETERLHRFFNEMLASDGWELRVDRTLPGLDGSSRATFVG